MKTYVESGLVCSVEPSSYEKPLVAKRDALQEYLGMQGKEPSFRLGFQLPDSLNVSLLLQDEQGLLNAGYYGEEYSDTLYENYLVLLEEEYEAFPYSLSFVKYGRLYIHHHSTYTYDDLFGEEEEKKQFTFSEKEAMMYFCDKEAIHWFSQILDETYDNFDEYENTDNLRIAEVGNKEEEERYEKARERGCCGGFDEIYVHEKTGRTFMIGFNYGH